MKIACAYHPRVHIGCGKFHFVADALRTLGHDVVHVETMDDLKRADQACELVLHEQRGPASLCLADLREFLPRRKAIHFQWWFDLNVFDDSLSIEKQSAFAPFLEVAQGMDLVFVKERDRLSEYRNAGVCATWLDQGCPSAMRQTELREHPEFDVILWGSASRPMWRQRWEDVETLVEAGFSVAWGSNDGNLPDGVHRLPGCQPLDLPELIQRAKVTLVVDARQDIRGYWSDRIWLAAGAGACIVRRIGSVNDHGSGNLPGWGYASGKVLVEMTRELCDSFAKRKRSGDFARTLTFSGNLYIDRCQEVVNHVQRHIHERLEDTALSGVSGNEEGQSENHIRKSSRTALPSLH